jgi:hypothetical protein
MTPASPASPPFWLLLGPYYLVLPGYAAVAARIRGPFPGTDPLAARTYWEVTLGRFQLLIYLDPVLGPDNLKGFIDFSTRDSVVTPPVAINGIAGVSYGSYAPPVTSLEWWLKKGDTMICILLSSPSDPAAAPTDAERAEHAAIIASLTYQADDSYFQRPGPSP